MEAGVKVFISGPMRGIENWNRHKFNEWERKLREKGEYDPVNPVKIGDKIASPEETEKDGELLYRVLRADIAELSKCEAIFMLNGWEKSEGARKELEYALRSNKRVLLESDYMAKEEEYDANGLASRIERFSSRYGVHEDLKRLAIMMTEVHPTLVQSFTSGFIFQFVKKMAENFRTGRFDGRNKLSAIVCEDMWTCVEDKYNLDKGEDIKLPMI